jgi:hypothetical protein
MTVTNIDELEEATRWWRLLTTSAPIHLELSDLDEEQSRHVQSAIDRYMASCGCREGQIGIAVSLGLFVLFLLVHPWALHMTGWAKFGVGFGVACVGASVGKITGVFRARMLLRRSIRTLKKSQ